MRDSPEVQTKLGRLRGQYVSVKGKESGVHAFLGVPFAKPPLGPTLRLAAPQPAEGWQGLRDAMKQPNIMDVANELIDKLGLLISEVPERSEDCLYLNIYSPANRAPDAKLPVRIAALNMCIHVSFLIHTHFICCYCSYNIQRHKIFKFQIL
uniref:Carboxylesterase type B domain-containing protein n=1 Tax=Poecilia latipinna TaxID=48699 RepID=A0A3B3UP42_9TELE